MQDVVDHVLRMNSMYHDETLPEETRLAAREYRNKNLAHIDDWRAYSKDGRSEVFNRLYDSIDYSDRTAVRRKLNVSLQEGSEVALNGMLGSPIGPVPSLEPPVYGGEELLYTEGPLRRGDPLPAERIRHVFQNVDTERGKRGVYKALFLQDDGRWIPLPNKVPSELGTPVTFGPKGEAIFESPWKELPRPHGAGVAENTLSSVGVKTRSGAERMARLHALGVVPFDDAPVLIPGLGLEPGMLKTAGQRPITASSEPPGLVEGLLGGQRFTIPKELAGQPAYYDDPQTRRIYDAWAGSDTQTDPTTGERYFIDSTGEKHTTWDLPAIMDRNGKVTLSDGTEVHLTEGALRSFQWEKGGGLGAGLIGALHMPGGARPEDGDEIARHLSAMSEWSEFAAARGMEVFARIMPGMEPDEDHTRSYYTDSPWGPIGIANLTGNLERDRALMREPGMVRALKDAKESGWFQALQWTGQGAAFLTEMAAVTRGAGAVARGTGVAARGTMRAGAWAAERTGLTAGVSAARSLGVGSAPAATAATAATGNPILGLGARAVKAGARGFKGARGVPIIPTGHHADVAMIGQFIAHGAVTNIALGQGTIKDAVYSGVETGTAMWMMGNVARAMRRLARPIYAGVRSRLDLGRMSPEAVARNLDWRKTGGLETLAGGLPDNAATKLIVDGVKAITELRGHVDDIARRTAAGVTASGMLSRLRTKAQFEQLFDSAFVGHMFGAWQYGQEQAMYDGADWSDLQTKAHYFTRGLFSPASFGSELAFALHSLGHAAMTRRNPPEWSASPLVQKQVKAAVDAAMELTRTTLSRDPSAASAAAVIIDATLQESLGRRAKLSSRGEEGRDDRRPMKSTFEAALAADRRIFRGGDALVGDADPTVTGNEVEHLGYIITGPSGRGMVREILGSNRISNFMLEDFRAQALSLPTADQIRYGRDVVGVIDEVLKRREEAELALEATKEQMDAWGRSLEAVGEGDVPLDPRVERDEKPRKERPDLKNVDPRSYFEPTELKDALGGNVPAFRVTGRPLAVVQRPTKPGGEPRWVAINAHTGKMLKSAPPDGWKSEVEAMAWILTSHSKVVTDLDNLAARHRGEQQTKARRLTETNAEREARALEQRADRLIDQEGEAAMLREQAEELRARAKEMQGPMPEVAPKRPAAEEQPGKLADEVGPFTPEGAKELIDEYRAEGGSITAEEWAAGVYDSWTKRKLEKRRRDKIDWSTDLTTETLNDALEEAAWAATQIAGNGHLSEIEALDKETKPGDFQNTQSAEAAVKRIRAKAEKKPKPKPAPAKPIEAAPPERDTIAEVIGEVGLEGGDAAGLAQAVDAAREAEAQREAQREVEPAAAARPEEPAGAAAVEPEGEIAGPGSTGAAWRFWRSPELQQAFELGASIFGRTSESNRTTRKVVWAYDEGKGWIPVGQGLAGLEAAKGKLRQSLRWGEVPKDESGYARPGTEAAWNAWSRGAAAPVSKGIGGELREVLLGSVGATPEQLDAMAAGALYRLAPFSFDDRGVLVQIPKAGSKQRAAVDLVAAVTGLPAKRVEEIYVALSLEANAQRENPRGWQQAELLDRLIPGWDHPKFGSASLLSYIASGAPLKFRVGSESRFPSPAKVEQALREYIRDRIRDPDTAAYLNVRISDIAKAMKALPKEARDLRGALIRKLSLAHSGRKRSSNGAGHVVTVDGRRTTLGTLADEIIGALTGQEASFDKSVRGKQVEVRGKDGGTEAVVKNEAVAPGGSVGNREDEIRLEMFTEMSRTAKRLALTISRMHHIGAEGYPVPSFGDEAVKYEGKLPGMGNVVQPVIGAQLRRLAAADQQILKLMKLSVDSTGKPLFPRPEAMFEEMVRDAQEVLGYTKSISHTLAAEGSSDRAKVDAVWRALEHEAIQGGGALPDDLIAALEARDDEVFGADSGRATHQGRLALWARHRFSDWIRGTFAKQEEVISSELGTEYLYAGISWHMLKPFSVDMNYELKPWFGPRGRVKVGKILDKLASNPPTSKAGMALSNALFSVVDGIQQAFLGGQRSTFLTEELTRLNLSTRRIRIANGEVGDRILAEGARVVDRVRKMNLPKEAQVILARAIDSGAYFSIRSEAEWEHSFGRGTAPMFHVMRDIVRLFDAAGLELVKAGVLDLKQFKKWRGRYFPIRTSKALQAELATRTRAVIMAGLSPATAGERSRSGAASIDDMFETFDISEILPASLAGEVARARVHGTIGEIMRSVGRSEAEFEALNQLEQVGWERATSEGRDPITGEKATSTQVRLELWAQEEEAATGEGGSPMTDYKRETLSLLRDSFIPKNALAEIDLILDLADGTIREQAVIQETINYWRRLKTIENAKHWFRNTISSVFTNHLTGRISWLDFAQGVFTGKGVYADTARDLQLWYEWVQAGRQDLYGRERAENIELIDQIAHKIGHGTFARTTFDPATLYDLIGSMFSPSTSGLPPVPTTSGDAPSRSVAAALWKRGPGQANWDKRIAALRGDPNPQARAQAQIELQHLYQLTELFWKVAAVRNGLNSSNGKVSLQDAVEWGVEGTADYANRNPHIYRMSSRFRMTLSGREELATREAGHNPRLRATGRVIGKLSAGPFWQYALQMVPAATWASMNHPLRTLGTAAVLIGAHKAIFGTDGEDHEDLREALSGMPGWGTRPLTPDVERELRRQAGDMRASNWFNGALPHSSLPFGELIDEFQSYARNVDALAGPTRGGRPTATSLGEVVLPAKIASRIAQGGVLEGLKDFSVGWMAGQSLSFAGRALEVLGDAKESDSLGEGALRAANATLREWSSDLGGGLFGSVFAPTVQKAAQEFSHDGRSFVEALRGIRRPAVTAESLGQRAGRFATDLFIGAQDAPDIPATEPGQGAVAKLLEGTTLGRMLERSTPRDAVEGLSREARLFARDFNKQVGELWADGYATWLGSGPRDLDISASGIFRQMLDLGADISYEGARPTLRGEPRTEIGKFIRAKARGDRARERDYLEMALTRLERLGSRPVEALEILANERQIHPALLRRAARGMIERESLLPFLYRMVVKEHDTENLRTYHFLWERGGYSTARYESGPNLTAQRKLHDAFTKAGFNGIPEKPSSSEFRKVFGGSGYSLVPEEMFKGMVGK